MPENKSCGWAGNDQQYLDYHDTEWGVPKAGEIELLEKIALEGFQAGLSWITILRKRENFRKAFKNFDPEKVARFNDKHVEKLMADTGIVRNRAKIEATISNAKAYLAMREHQSLGHFFWDFVDGKPVQNKLTNWKKAPASTDISAAISKELKKRGFRFFGPTTAYAMMQSIGMVNDHVTTCPAHKRCAALAKKFKAPKA